MARFERAASGPQTSALTKLSYLPSRRDCSIRTCASWPQTRRPTKLGYTPAPEPARGGPPPAGPAQAPKDLRWRAEGQVHLVGLAGLEPAASCSRSTRSTKLS